MVGRCWYNQRDCCSYGIWCCTRNLLWFI